MSDDIKSARDIALEKIAALDSATSDERMKWKFTPKGVQLAIKYFKDCEDLTAVIAAYPAEAQPFVKSGAEKVLLDNVQLPYNDVVSARNNKALDAVLYIKHDKAAATKMLEQIKHILGHYADQGEVQRKEAQALLKQQFEAKIKQAVKAQGGADGDDTGLGINVTTLPQFQEELRRTITQMDNQYLSLLDEYKRELRNIK
ncbi:MAG: hypothetical protein FWF98_04725 [Dehalococcoidia bacterium]|nr:hypothetical protein [Dehalococcoidia bacterium]